MRTGWAARALQWCRSVLSSALSGRSSLSQLPSKAALLGSLRRACLGGVARCTVADWHVWRMLKSLSCSVSIAAPSNYRTRCPALGRASWLSARRPGRLALKQLFSPTRRQVCGGGVVVVAPPPSSWRRSARPACMVRNLPTSTVPSRRVRGSAGPSAFPAPSARPQPPQACLPGTGGRGPAPGRPGPA